MSKARLPCDQQSENSDIESLRPDISATHTAERSYIAVDLINYGSRYRKQVGLSECRDFDIDSANRHVTLPYFNAISNSERAIKQGHLGQSN